MVLLCSRYQVFSLSICICQVLYFIIQYKHMSRANTAAAIIVNNGRNKSELGLLSLKLLNISLTALANSVSFISSTNRVFSTGSFGTSSSLLPIRSTVIPWQQRNQFKIAHCPQKSTYILQLKIVPLIVFQRCAFQHHLLSFGLHTR